MVQQYIETFDRYCRWSIFHTIRQMTTKSRGLAIRFKGANFIVLTGNSQRTGDARFRSSNVHTYVIESNELCHRRESISYTRTSSNINRRTICRIGKIILSTLILIKSIYRTATLSRIQDLNQFSVQRDNSDWRWLFDPNWLDDFLMIAAKWRCNNARASRNDACVQRSIRAN